MSQMPEVKEIQYSLSNGGKETAEIIPIDVSLDGLSKNEIQVLGHLSKASDAITPVYARQQHDNMLSIYRSLASLEDRLDGSDKDAISDFNTILNISNSLWTLPGDAIAFPFSRERAEQLLDPKIISALFDHPRAPPGRAVYPVDGQYLKPFITNLPANINSSVVWNAGNPEVVLHEDRYRAELNAVRAGLVEALHFSQDPNLRAYMRAKQEELNTGSAQSMEQSAKAWIENKGSIDFIIGTGDESYHDKIFSIRGMAQATINVQRSDYQELVNALLGMMPELEATAPWDHKKQVDYSNLPNLRFVDVITRAGFYGIFPAEVRGQSLPNDKAFKDKYGSVNLIFVNVMKSLGRSKRESFIQEEFIAKAALTQYGETVSDMYPTHVALHELGHTMGGSTLQANPEKVFGTPYHLLEEQRAELVSMWKLPRLVEKGILIENQEVAGYYLMLSEMALAMSKDPVDHHGARNMMFNYFLEKGALTERTEEGKLKYSVNPVAMREAVSSALATIGNIKAVGDTEAFGRFMDRYMTTNRQQEFKGRITNMPMAVAALFPNMEMLNGRYTGNLIYPSDVRGQRRALCNFI